MRDSISTGSPETQGKERLGKQWRIRREGKAGRNGKNMRLPSHFSGEKENLGVCAVTGIPTAVQIRRA